MTRHAVAVPGWPKAVGYTLFAGVLGVLVLGAFADFIPAPLLSGHRWIAPMWLLGAGLTALVIVQAYRTGGWMAVFGRHVVNSVLAICLAPPLLGFLCWLMLARGGPWVYTRIAGAGFDEVHVMQTAYVRTARTCKYRLSGGPLQHRFPSHLCIDEAFYRRHPQQQLPVRLRGQRSVLGMRIAVIAEDS